MRKTHKFYSEPTSFLENIIFGRFGLNKRTEINLIDSQLIYTNVKHAMRLIWHSSLQTMVIYLVPETEVSLSFDSQYQKSLIGDV